MKDRSELLTLELIHFYGSQDTLAPNWILNIELMYIT